MVVRKITCITWTVNWSLNQRGKKSARLKSILYEFCTLSSLPDSQSASMQILLLSTEKLPNNSDLEPYYSTQNMPRKQQFFCLPHSEQMGKADLIRRHRHESDRPHRDVRSVMDEFCLPVKLSPCRSLFAASPNLATSWPGHGGFACLLIAPEGLGDESHWKMSAFGSGFFHENFSPFHPLLPPQIVIFLFCLACPPPPPGGLLLSILAPKWAAWTLIQCTQHCVPVSHLRVPHQNSTSTRFSTA